MGIDRRGDVPFDLEEIAGRGPVATEVKGATGKPAGYDVLPGAEWESGDAEILVNTGDVSAAAKAAAELSEG